MNKPKERPILFSGTMVRAILEGRKTQTRRVVKNAPDCWSPSIVGEFFPTVVDRWGNEEPGCRMFGAGDHDGECWISCPYGEPGDRLWVREEHYRFGHLEPVPGVKTKTGRMKWRFVAHDDFVLYDAPDEFRKGRHHKDSATPAWHKRLGRFMPRWASRITLDVVNVRVEQLGEITEADAIAEGAILQEDLDEGYSAVVFFKSLWFDINKTFDRRTWVWVVEFATHSASSASPRETPTRQTADGGDA